MDCSAHAVPDWLDFLNLVVTHSPEFLMVHIEEIPPDSDDDVCEEEESENSIEHPERLATIPGVEGASTEQPDKDSDDDQPAKDRGNEAFNDGQYEKAIEHWMRGVRVCQLVLSKDAYKGEQKKKIEDQLSVLNCNLAMGLIKLKRYQEACHRCDEVLKYDPSNVKALFRKSDALSQLGRLEECVTTLDKLLEIDPGINVARTKRSKVIYELARTKRKEKKMMKHLLSTIEADPRSQQEEGLRPLWSPFMAKAFSKKSVIVAVFVVLLIAFTTFMRRWY